MERLNELTRRVILSLLRRERDTRMEDRYLNSAFFAFDDDSWQCIDNNCEYRDRYHDIGDGCPNFDSAEADVAYDAALNAAIREIEAL